MSYFDGIKEGIKIYTVDAGWVEVFEIKDHYMRHNIYTRDNEGTCRQYSYEGVRIGNTLQTAFWDKVEIIPPPRPKRSKKVKIEVRPLRSPDGDIFVLNGNPSPFSGGICGPAQIIEVEVEDD